MPKKRERKREREREREREIYSVCKIKGGRTKFQVKQGRKVNL